MIKIFDFKFLILLGLAIIIYLIYRELEQQRIKIQDCEVKILNLTKLQENKSLENNNREKELSTFEILTLRKQEALKEQAEIYNYEYELKSQINFECSTTRRKSYITRMHQRYAKLMTKRVGDELLNGGLL